MDLSKIHGMIDPHENEEEYDDDDLEAELNAIISGGAKPKTVASKTVASKTVASKTAASKTAVNHNQRSSSNAKSQLKRQPQTDDVGYDLTDIEKLTIIGDDDDADDDDADIDENNEDLLAEISQIVSNPSSAKRVRNPQTQPSIPPPDYSEDVPIRDNRNAPSNLKNEFVVNTKLESNISNDIRKNEPIKSPQLIDNSKASPSIEQIRRPSPVKSVAKEETITPSHNRDNSDMIRLVSLRDEYKKCALMSKKLGDQSTALTHIKTAKQLEIFINALENGQSVDLSQLPPPPSSLASNASSNPSQSLPHESSSSSSQIEENFPEMNAEEEVKIFGAPPPPKTVMEALEQRVAKFKSTLEQAQAENNTSKIRRLGRIVKQYETAIRDHKAGKPVEFDDLPAPPGFGPIPKEDAPTQKPPTPSHVSKPQNPTPVPAPSAKRPLPSGNAQPPPAIRKPQPQNPAPANEKVSPSNPPPPPPRGNLKRASSTANKQLNYLLDRQRMFKEAALESKAKGDVQQAKEYLRCAKGFDPLIEATRNGLPIDATSIPTPPQLAEDFVIVSHPQPSDSVTDLEREEMYRKIEMGLHDQIEKCKRNHEYFLQLGDVSTASKFEKYATESKKDLDMLTARWRNGDKVPSYKYEMRSFSVVICNTEVGTNEVSVEVLKALDIPGKNDIDTYIRVEFPFPNDTPQSRRTKTVKNTINPVFNETFKFEIDRKSRQLPRVFKRHPIKLELISKGGFLRSDTVIGTALVKLTEFETKCTIHESYPLTEGRKIVGGKIEARVRIREPLLAKQVEEVKEKWLIFT